MRIPSIRRHGFTLIEVMLASVAAALILAAVYGVFQRAIKLRDSATQRTGDSRLRLRAANIIRNDLRNALVSGGILAGILQGDSVGTDGGQSGFPGYLKMTTTTGKDTDDDLYGDVQQVEYYIVKDPAGTAAGGGNLVRAVTRDLLETTTPHPEEQPILSGVQSMQVSFYANNDWQPSWAFNIADSGTSSGTGSTAGSLSTSGSESLPEAIRVDIQQAAPAAKDSTPTTPPPLLEITVPWTTQPFTSPTPAPSASPT